jgi:serine/threonine-protein kinase
MPDAAVGRDGTLLYAEGTAVPIGGYVAITRVARDGSVDTTLTKASSLDGSMSLSPDGSRVVLSVADSATGHGRLFVISLDTGIATRLTFTGEYNFGPAWSPDGATVLYVSDADEEIGLWTKPADGSGQAAPVEISESRPIFEGCWSPDGAWLVYRTDTGSKGDGDILAVRTGGDTTPIPLVTTDAREVSPAISPDGHWLAYVSNASGRPEVYVRPFPNTVGGIWQISEDGGAGPRWSHSGRELFYRNVDGDLVAVAVSDAPTFTPGAHTTLFNARRFVENPSRHTYAVMPDDEHFVFLQPLDETQATDGGLVLMRNWLSEVTGR